MLILAVILSSIAILVAWCALAIRREMRRQKQKKMRVSFDAFVWGLQPLLERLRPGALLAAHPNGRDGFLQLVLTGREGIWREVEFGLPDADWSRPHFDRAVLALQAHSPEWGVEESPGNPDVPRFLRVWIDGDEYSVRERTADLLRSAAQVLGFPADQTYNIEFIGQEHPEYMRWKADELEHHPRLPRFFRRLAPMLRREADEAERAMKSAH